jgi:transaldolase
MAVTPLRLYADSADLHAVERLLTDGLVRGVTTNPTILAGCGWTAADRPELAARWFDAGAEEVFFQAVGDSVQEMLADADRIRALHAVVKVPAVRAGWTVARRLAADGWPTLVTAVYTVAQAACAGSVGASYIAPYLGRLGDRGVDGHELIAQMAAVLAGTPTRPLVASVRTSADVARLVLTGVCHVTAAPHVIEACFLNDDSESDARTFATDAGPALGPAGEPNGQIRTSPQR